MATLSWGWKRPERPPSTYSRSASGQDGAGQDFGKTDGGGQLPSSCRQGRTQRPSDSGTWLRPRRVEPYHCAACGDDQEAQGNKYSAKHAQGSTSFGSATRNRGGEIGGSPVRGAFDGGDITRITGQGLYKSFAFRLPRVAGGGWRLDGLYDAHQLARREGAGRAIQLV